MLTLAFISSQLYPWYVSALIIVTFICLDTLASTLEGCFIQIPKTFFWLCLFPCLSAFPLFRDWESLKLDQDVNLCLQLFDKENWQHLGEGSNEGEVWRFLLDVLHAESTSTLFLPNTELISILYIDWWSIKTLQRSNNKREMGYNFCLFTMLPLLYD